MTEDGTAPTFEEAKARFLSVTGLSIPEYQLLSITADVMAGPSDIIDNTKDLVRHGVFIRDETESDIYPIETYESALESLYRKNLVRLCNDQTREEIRILHALYPATIIPEDLCVEPEDGDVVLTDWGITIWSWFETHVLETRMGWYWVDTETLASEGLGIHFCYSSKPERVIESTTDAIERNRAIDNITKEPVDSIDIDDIGPCRDTWWRRSITGFRACWYERIRDPLPPNEGSPA